MTTTSPQGIKTTNTYDNEGNPLTSQSVWVDPNNSQNTRTLSTTNTYDGNGNLKRMVAPDGTTTTTYNADGEATTSMDNLGGPTSSVYDVNGNVIQTTTPDLLVSDTVYDAQGSAIYTGDPHLAGEPASGTHTLYDAAGNVVGTERLANVLITVTTSNGILSSVLTSVGAIFSSTSTAYDAAGRISQSVDASGLVTNNVYDAVGNLIQSDRPRATSGLFRKEPSVGRVPM